MINAALIHTVNAGMPGSKVPAIVADPSPATYHNTHHQQKYSTNRYTNNDRIKPWRRHVGACYIVEDQSRG